MLILLLAASPLDELAPEAYERLRNAYVEVLVDDRLEGSGWIADPEGVAVTAAHVVHAPGRRVEVRSERLGRIAARVRAVDRGNDAALLALPRRDGGYPAVPLGERLPGPSGRVWLLGSPVYRHGLLLGGRIARDVDAFEFMAFSGDYVRVRHVSGSGPPGSSGGPWVTPRGEVVGLNSGLMRDGASPTSVGFLVPVEPVRALLASGRSPATPTLGAAFEEIWEQPAAYLRRFPPGTEGLVLRALRKEGPAAAAGLSDGQLLLAIDGRPLRLRDEAVAALRARKAGDVVKLAIHGSGETAVTLGNLEADWAAAR